MPTLSGWLLVAATAATTTGTALLIGYLRHHRERPGARWFLASLACQGLWSLSYGGALFVFDPTVRWWLELVGLALLAGLGLFFLLFAVEYTGRGRVPDGLPSVLVGLSPVGILAVLASNPVHGLWFSGYAVDPVWGLSTTALDLEPAALVPATLAVALPLVGSVLLFDTVLSYGRLYRREAAAVGLSTHPPAVPLALWLYGVGPLPQVNLAPVLFLPHVVLDAYAFFESDMFDFHPATRRAGERAAIDDLGSPVVIVDDEGRVVTLNAAAESVLDADKRAVLTTPLGEHLPEPFDPTDDGRVSLPVEGVERTYAVTSTPLTDRRAGVLGYTLVWQDLTEELRREQRLEVLNRVLRHNLRNDMTVVEGYAHTVRSQTDDEDVVAMLDTVVDTADDLTRLGATAREIERVLAGDPTPERVELRSFLAGIVEDCADVDPEATVETEIEDVAVTADPSVLRSVCTELLDNALRHAGPAPTVRVVATTDPGRIDGTVATRATPDGGDPGGEDREGGDAGDDGAAVVDGGREDGGREDGGRGDGETVVVAVVDDGPGIPESERSVIEARGETALDHGSGLGLWLVRWGAERLGTRPRFDTGEDGTTVALSLPRDD